MRNQPTSPKTNNAITPKPGIWTRFWKAYQEKKHTDQTFYATVVTVQVALVACIILAAVILMVSDQRLGSSFLPGGLR